ncbi:MAG: SurA N-terminal domain-containing protein [Patescibacteria group bacterium]
MPKKQIGKIFKNRKKYIKKLGSNKSFVLGLAAIIILSILYLFKGAFVAAVVNGQPISRISVVRDLEKRGGAETLDSLINQVLIFQEAKKQNVSITDEEIDSVIGEIEASLEGQGDLDQMLLLRGMTRDELVKQIQMQKLVEKMLAERVSVTDAEVSEYIETNSATLPEDATDQEINELVKNQLKQQKLSSEIELWLAELKQQAKINYFVEY